MMNNSKIVVKDNALIDASFNLSLVEQRIMLLAIVGARESLNLTPDVGIEVAVNDYIKEYSIESNNVYSHIREAAKTLKRREFSYLDRYKGYEALTTANWVNRVTYVDSNGLVILYFSQEVISLISRLSEQFTKYHIKQVSDFKSKYSIRLYELVIKWLTVEKTEKYSIASLRSKLGLEYDEYSTMSNFKSNVLDKAVNEINKHTDITIDYEQFKKGRIITDIQFSIKSKVKSKPSKVTNQTAFHHMTDAQINMFGNQLAQLPDLAYLAVGNESYEALASRIKDMLQDQSKQIQFIPYLKTLGFSAK
ncbi:replication initiation protein [Acinetobacter sp. B10A]|uniref:replication initiation protein RepM n=1 Tax=Acinetobacter baretiae TaxID=2605383 RepID=UPI001B3C8673|nr:replication initiation protein RepM [Acinetobacter baretiae]MBF7686524.1 replication initiation protein [Acinetobacter baretiae]